MPYLHRSSEHQSCSILVAEIKILGEKLCSSATAQPLQRPGILRCTDLTAQPRKQFLHFFARAARGTSQGHLQQHEKNIIQTNPKFIVTTIQTTTKHVTDLTCIRQMFVEILDLSSMRLIKNHPTTSNIYQFLTGFD